ncbi:hypothetical protein [Klebsiella michiganensis]
MIVRQSDEKGGNRLLAPAMLIENDAITRIVYLAGKRDLLPVD